MIRIILVLVLFSILPTAVHAQPKTNQRFAAAGHLGLNLAQIDGDYYFGYHKPGLNFGVETQLLLHPKYFVSVGISYSQMGAKPTRKEITERGGRSIELRINSVEIPVLFNYRLGMKDEVTQKTGFRLFRSSVLQVGVLVSRSTGFRVSEFGNISLLPRNQNFVSVQNEFNPFDLYALIGITVPVSMHYSFYLQHNKSIFGLYQPEVMIKDEVLPLFPYALSLGVRYVIY